MKKRRLKMHLVIPDTQNKFGTPVNHLEAAGQMVCDLMPDVISNIGDWWDMPSLSSYDMGQLAGEGTRYQTDIHAGNVAMDVFMEPIKKFQATPRGRSYRPRMIFTIGNHEQRIQRHVDSHPFLDGKLAMSDLNLAGWRIYKFQELAEADGIFYSHYFANPMSGKPYGGTMQNLLNKIGMSFTMGHVQKLDFGRKDLANGKVIQGLVAGAFYQHEERYKGPQGNKHWRGIIVKHDVYNGNYDLETYSIERLLKVYG